MVTLCQQLKSVTLYEFTLTRQLSLAEISLAVTKGVLEYIKAPREKERQIAYTAPSADIADLLGEVTRLKHVKLRLSGRITLVVGD
jgi:hypothetical protein